MHLLVIRHAIAVDRASFPNGEDDDQRPLTDDGRRKMRRIAKGLHGLVGRPDVLVASPLKRAIETADILSSVYGMKAGKPVEALRPDSRFTMLASWAAEHDVDATIAVVGHEPHLSGLISWLMTGDNEPHTSLKKGGACLLSFDGKVRRAAATLEWLLTAAQLRQLAD